MTYNATAYKKRADGTTFSVEAVEVKTDGKVIRACGFWSPLNGTDGFEEAWESAQFSEIDHIHIERDAAEGYSRHVARTDQPKVGRYATDDLWGIGAPDPSDYPDPMLEP